jgi:hypothetical protein
MSRVVESCASPIKLLCGLVLLFTLTPIMTYAQSMPRDNYDVLGIKIGMGIDEARQKIHAALGDKITETFETKLAYPGGPFLRVRYRANNGEAITAGPATSVEDMMNRAYQFRSMEPTQTWKGLTEKIVLYLDGLPDHEVVTAIGRGHLFPENQRPPIDQITKPLRQKYGLAPTSILNKQTVFDWDFDQHGKLLTSHSPFYDDSECPLQAGVSDIDLTRQDPLNGMSVDDRCGSNIEAVITPSPTNPLLVKSVIIAMVDQPLVYHSLVKQKQFVDSAVEAKQNKEKQQAPQNPGIKF